MGQASGRGRDSRDMERQRAPGVSPFSPLLPFQTGPGREFYEKFFRASASYLNFLSNFIGLYLRLQLPWAEGFLKMQDKLRGKDGPPGAEEAYRAWIESCHECFQEYLRTEEFATELSEYTNSFLELKKSFDELGEMYLRSLSIATPRELDEIFHEIFRINEKIKGIREELAALREELHAPDKEG